jgi:arylsulfatase
MKKTLIFLVLVLSISCTRTLKDQPNIVLIMGDDIGFSDIGCYGSEIKTPSLDRLAEDGARFRTFYNMAKCDPSRSTLLTGMYWNKENVTNFASLLRNAGYTTLHSGKEHYDPWVPESIRAVYNFDQSFTMWANNEYFIPPDSTFAHPFYLNGRELTAHELAKEFPDFYKTDVITDYALRFLEYAKREGKPFFLYLPYNAAHYPLQAEPSDIEKYLQVYEPGWDIIRKERYERMQELGIIDDKYALSEPTDNINKFRGHPAGDEDIRDKIPLYRPWESMDEKEKEELVLEMAVFAAIVDRMDGNIGRVVQWLKDNDKFDNTLIMYLSDNGSCPYDSNRDFVHPPGPADSYRCLSAAWANVGNTPFRYFKQFGHEGGSHTQFIVHWPEKIKPGQIITQTGHIVDIYPTMLDIAGTGYPDTLSRLDGTSLLPLFLGNQRPEPEYYISGYTEKFRMFRQGEYKIVRANNGPWELYNVLADPSETVNLADSMPDIVSGLENLYNNKK